MKKPVFPRILGLLLLYSAVFVLLVVVQFARKGNFSLRVGAMTVNGHYLEPPEGNYGSAPRASSLLSGGASIHFGGLEFNLKNRESNENFVIIGENNQPFAVQAEVMHLSDDTVSFTLSNGAELFFRSLNTGGLSELLISGKFPEGVTGLEIPVRLQGASLVRDANADLPRIAHGRVTYQFNRPVQVRERGIVLIPAGLSYLSYRAIPVQKTLSPADFTITQANNPGTFDESLLHWRDQQYLQWSRSVSSNADEDTVIAYLSEALRRGNFRTAVSTASSAFPPSARSSYESSVYVGGMDSALRMFTASERDKLGQLSRYANSNPAELIKESNLVDFLMVRGYTSIFDNYINMIYAIDADTVTLDLCAAIFEGYMDMRKWHPFIENPFDRLTTSACNVLLASLHRDGKDIVLAYGEDSADVEYNLRLGKSLAEWADVTGRDNWAGVGRTLVLSVLALIDHNGTASAFIPTSGSGGFSENAPRLSSAQLYRVLSPGDYYPHAAGYDSGINGLWAWTSASSFSAIRENNVLDISVSFPVGETHHMMIRGVEPFSKMQIYFIDYPTDSQFERYDSSGWVYSPQERILLLKMKHRTTVENIRIFYYRDEPRPAPAVESGDENGGESAGGEE